MALTLTPDERSYKMMYLKLSLFWQ